MESKIIRRKDFVGGGLTAKEQAAMAVHTKKWIANAMRTAPIEPDKIIPAIHGLYAAAKLKQPRVVIVPSPLVMAVAGGFATAIWAARKATLSATRSATASATYFATRSATHSATHSATDSATDLATYLATESATHSATYLATASATYLATYLATDLATYSATDLATYLATYLATESATESATDLATASATASATDLATHSGWAAQIAHQIGGPKFAPMMLKFVHKWTQAYQGGNMWSGWTAYLSATRDILGLDLPEHAAFASWETAAKEGGFRFMHEEFCMVSDFPEILLKDDQHRPHCDDGPSHRWRDGWSLYHVHGVVVPEYVVMHPETITIALIDAERNAEVRRVMMERYGIGRYLLDSGANVVSHDEYGILYRKQVPDDVDVVMVRVLNSTPEPDGVMTRDEAITIFGAAARYALDTPAPSRWKEYMIRVPANMETAHQAVAWTFSMTPDEYNPELET